MAAVTPPGVTDSEPDARLIEQAKRAPGRFTAIFDRHHRAIYAYVARRLGPDLAEDVASETFLTAFDRRHSYDAAHGERGRGCSGSPRTWSRGTFAPSRGATGRSPGPGDRTSPGNAAPSTG